MYHVHKSRRIPNLFQIYLYANFPALRQNIRPELSDKVGVRLPKAQSWKFISHTNVEKGAWGSGVETGGSQRPVPKATSCLPWCMYLEPKWMWLEKNPLWHLIDEANVCKRNVQKHQNSIRALHRNPPHKPGNTTSMSQVLKVKNCQPRSLHPAKSYENKEDIPRQAPLRTLDDYWVSIAEGT